MNYWFSSNGTGRFLLAGGILSGLSALILFGFALSEPPLSGNRSPGPEVDPERTRRALAADRAINELQPGVFPPEFELRRRQWEAQQAAATAEAALQAEMPVEP